MIFFKSYLLYIITESLVKREDALHTNMGIMKNLKHKIKHNAPHPPPILPPIHIQPPPIHIPTPPIYIPPIPVPIKIPPIKIPPLPNLPPLPPIELPEIELPSLKIPTIKLPPVPPIKLPLFSNILDELNFSGGKTTKHKPKEEKTQSTPYSPSNEEIAIIAGSGLVMLYFIWDN
jgi:hypothetical protein